MFLNFSDRIAQKDIAFSSFFSRRKQLKLNTKIQQLHFMWWTFQQNMIKNFTFVFYNSCSFFFFHFLNFWSIQSKKWSSRSKAKFISFYRVDLFTFTPILRHIEWKLWTSIKVSHRLGKHFSFCFLILLFFLQFVEYNLKAPPYSKTLHYSRISVSRPSPQFRIIYNWDCGYSSCGNVALEKCKISIS